MYFSSLQDLITMDGHGPYVWGAYGIGLFVMGALVFIPWWRHHQQLNRLRRVRNTQGQ